MQSSQMMSSVTGDSGDSTELIKESKYIPWLYVGMIVVNIFLFTFKEVRH